MSLCAEKSRPAQEIGRSGNATPEASPQIDATDPSTLRQIVYSPASPEDGFEALEAEWNQLLAKSRFNSIFLTYEWQTTWWEQLGEGELWIVAFRSPEDDQLVGIVPLYLIPDTSDPESDRRRFNLVGCIEVSDYLDIIAAKGWEATVYAGLLAWLHSERAPQWDVLDLCNLPQDSLTHQLLPGIFSAPYSTRPSIS